MAFEVMEDPVAAEGRRADQLKKDERFTVVIGNPPYEREQRAVGDTGKRKGGVVRYGAAGISPLLEDVIRPMSDAGLGKHAPNLHNLYVYFWRWAVWQATELPPGPSIVTFITASSYLEGFAMGGVRSLLRSAFDELLIVDLGGEGRGALIEENIFDIQTPVAIAFALRKGIPSSSCTVRHLCISGSRQEKFERLGTLTLDMVATDVHGKGLERLVPHDDQGAYWSWPIVTDLFPWRHSGAKFHRTWPIGETLSLLRQRWSELVTAVPRKRSALLFEKEMTATSTPIPLLHRGQRLRPIQHLDRDDRPESIERYGYRSFDRQWAIADKRVADRPRPVLWRVRGGGQLFLTTLTSAKLGRGPALTVTPYVPDIHHFSGRGAKNVMPIYRDPSSREPNVPGELLETLSQTVDEHLTVEDLVAYVHGLLGTGAFTDRFTDELAEIVEPVHIPFTASPDLFNRAVELGRELLWYQTWGERSGPDDATTLPPGTVHRISPIEGYPDTFRHRPDDQILEVGTGRFGPVSEDVWNFEVSGLKVLSSWLGYRMAQRKGKKAGPLSEIRPRSWVFTDELLCLISILQHTIDMTPTAAQLLDEIVSGPLLLATDLPQPTDAERKPPKV